MLVLIIFLNKIIITYNIIHNIIYIPTIGLLCYNPIIELEERSNIMFFQIKEPLNEIKPNDVNEDTLTLGIISLEELDQYYKIFGFSPVTVEECKHSSKHIHGAIDVYEDYHFGVITGIDTKYLMKTQDRFGIYMKHNLFLIVIIEDQDDSIKNKLLETVRHINLSKVTIEKLIYGFLERLIKDDFIILEKLEKKISEYEDIINSNKMNKDINFVISGLRKRLLLQNNYYEQLIQVGEDLEENVLDLFEEDQLRYFALFSNRVSRLSNTTRMLQDYCIHVRDAYHSQMDYNLNNIMKLFTVVTSIFLPLTLIVGWYGMNFTTMPELTWKYGYLFVIVITVVVAVAFLFYFKKKKFL
jgi:magnesium transporter